MILRGKRIENTLYFVDIVKIMWILFLLMLLLNYIMEKWFTWCSNKVQWILWENKYLINVRMTFIVFQSKLSYTKKKKLCCLKNILVNSTKYMGR